MHNQNVLSTSWSIEIEVKSVSSFKISKGKYKTLKYTQKKP
jgi:hypothetical protein